MCDKPCIKCLHYQSAVETLDDYGAVCTRQEEENDIDRVTGQQIIDNPVFCTAERYPLKTEDRSACGESGKFFELAPQEGVQILRLAPDDILVFRVTEPIIESQIEQLRRTGKALAPNNRCAVVADHVELSVIAVTKGEEPCTD